MDKLERIELSALPIALVAAVVACGSIFITMQEKKQKMNEVLVKQPEKSLPVEKYGSSLAPMGKPLSIVQTESYQTIDDGDNSSLDSPKELSEIRQRLLDEMKGKIPDKEYRNLEQAFLELENIMKDVDPPESK